MIMSLPYINDYVTGHILMIMSQPYINDYVTAI